MKSRLPAAALTITAALFFAGLPAAHAAVVTYIDLLTTQQTNAVYTYDSSATNTIATTGTAIGGFRTVSLSSTNNDSSGFDSSLLVRTNVGGGGPRLVLTSQENATTTFQVTYGGAGGTSGFGPIDFTGGLGTNFSLVKSTLDFNLRSSSITNAITWTFTDTNSVSATYEASLPVNLAPNPAIPFAISLASFGNASAIDWTSINFITLSGGGTSLNMSFSAPFSVTAQPIPEPGTWAAAGLLVLAAFYIRRRRMRAASQEEAPAAA